MKLIAVLLLAIAASSSSASERERNNDRQQQMAVQVAKASGGGATVTVTGDPDDDAAAIAPNPSAPAPSAQCRFGWSVTGAAVPFGAGITASEWDEICGLWLAAQQVTGEARREAAAAAFCLTMKKAKVKSPTCVDWANGQGMTTTEVALDPQQRPSIDFGGVGSYGGRN